MSILNEQESSQGLEDEVIMSVVQVQREQLLAEAKLEIQKNTKRKSVSMKTTYIRDQKSHIDSRDWDLRRLFNGYLAVSSVKD